MCARSTTGLTSKTRKSRFGAAGRTSDTQLRRPVSVWLSRTVPWPLFWLGWSRVWPCPYCGVQELLSPLSAVRSRCLGDARWEEEGCLLLLAGCCQVLPNHLQTPDIKSARYTLTFVKSSHCLFPDFSTTKSLLSPVLLNLSSLSWLSKVPLSDVMGREPQNRTGSPPVLSSLKSKGARGRHRGTLAPQRPPRGR